MFGEGEGRGEKLQQHARCWAASLLISECPGWGAQSLGVVVGRGWVAVLSEVSLPFLALEGR